MTIEEQISAVRYELLNGQTEDARNDIDEMHLDGEQAARLRQEIEARERSGAGDVHNE